MHRVGGFFILFPHRPKIGVKIAEAGCTRLLDGASRAPPFVPACVDINAFVYKRIVSSTASNFTTAIIPGGDSTFVRRMASRIDEHRCRRKAIHNPLLPGARRCSNCNPFENFEKTTKCRQFVRF
jgi:hypothetical protein